MRHWPLTALELTTPDLTLRLPTERELDELAQVAAAGVHPVQVPHFPQPWASGPPSERARNVLQNHWWARGDWSRDNWRLLLAVFRDGQVIGQQNLSARDFLVNRQARTGSWLGQEYQGRGFGTQMRAAALALAFDGLGAHRVTSTAFTHNAASLAVSRKLGYRPNGRHHIAVAGELIESREEFIDRDGWSAHEPLVPVAMSDLHPCFSWFC